MSETGSVPQVGASQIKQQLDLLSELTGELQQRVGDLGVRLEGVTRMDDSPTDAQWASAPDEELVPVAERIRYVAVATANTLEVLSSIFRRLEV